MIDKNKIAQFVGQFMSAQTAEKVGCRFESISNKYVVDSVYQILEYEVFEFEDKSFDELYACFSQDELMFSGDPVSTIFFFLSGYWEYKNPEYTDGLGRYLGKESFAYKAGCLTIPVVDILVNTIFSDIKVSKSKFYNSPKFCVTHDIDFLKVPQLRPIAIDFLRKKDWRQGFKRIKNCLLGRNPFDLEQLLDKELDLGIKPICFMLNTVQNKATAGGYVLSKCRKEKQVIREKSRQGVEFGLHYSTDYLKTGSLGNYKEIEQYSENNADFGRAHYLVFNLLKSFDVCVKNKIAVDFSAGYRDCVGFRFGTSLPFQPYNFHENCAYNLWTVPLILMDGTWTCIQEDLKDDQQRKKVLETILTNIEKTNGLFTILWHNTSFTYDLWKKYEEWYWEIVKNLKQKAYLTINTQDILLTVKGENIGNRNQISD